ncbi:MAG: transcription-repair coupling factor, partial [Lachnospiraceae bacterium]|nr:transcription-repair coupling factor [Lachnospiraceae bacterium]
QYGKDTVWQREFEEMFPFEETEDQLAAIADTKADMESDKIMDRLICGDVGFGKTEIAIRSAFKAVQEGKQVAYLVPTTILAQQHYNTFLGRMKEYPVRIDMLSRFCTAKEIRTTLSDLKKGLVDIVIGTHRLLSKDVEFADLGLLVIDEEQRFGVTHKEKIKQMKENVDVLTLTATPIPRTLHMSMIGVRDMSVLEEAPQDRLPIQTYVMEYNEEMVREAIVRELARKGQVYYVFNRVEGIEEMTNKIAKLVPEARVAFAHGQMRETELENIMMDFIKQKIDVLVSTTIIETGLDIPNVNTMIIHDSDTFGLSQLYQLRGRVGRSNRTSYAFLMYRKDKLLKEVAEKRLTAIREFTELGSGYKIAMRDLEIRGAGTLLGKQQHGHMQAVGYDLYCKMLEEAVREEQGLEKVTDTAVSVDLDVDAYIPQEYIVNEVQKLDIYKRIASVRSEADCDEMRDELRDRFGAVPDQAENLLRIALLKAMAGDLYITEIRGKAGRVRIMMQQKAPVMIEEIPVLLNEYAGDLKMQLQGLPEFILTYEIDGLVEKDEKLLLDQTERLLRNMRMLYPGQKVPGMKDA